jgi:hypothetical protein
MYTLKNFVKFLNFCLRKELVEKAPENAPLPTEENDNKEADHYSNPQAMRNYAEDMKIKYPPF